MNATEGAQGEEVPGVNSDAATGWLTVYLKHPTADDVYYIGGAWAPASITARDKRFIDAELAAEYWKCMSGLYDGHGKAARMRRDTLYRFIALPHYDEEQP